ncbi:MAG: hypothetical protein V3V13_07205 [Paracoccaceae bacterium]
MSAVNDAIQVFAGYKALGAFPTDHIFESNLSAWHHDIEQVLEDEYAADSEKFNQAGSDAVGMLRNSKRTPCMSPQQ